SNSSLAALIQKQNNSINQHNESIEKNIDQLKLNQDNILNNLHSDNSESDVDISNNKANPYDSVPTLVALIRSKIKENDQNNNDSDESVEEEFMFDYSKPFTHRTNQRILKAYSLFYMKEYESQGEFFSKYKYN